MLREALSNAEDRIHDDGVDTFGNLELMLS